MFYSTHILCLPYFRHCPIIFKAKCITYCLKCHKTTEPYEDCAYPQTMHKLVISLVNGIDRSYAFNNYVLLL